MSIMLNVEELLLALRRAEGEAGTLAAAYERHLIDLCNDMAQAICCSVDCATECAVAFDPDRTDVWDGGVMVGFRPANGDYSQPIPKVLAGFDDDGWEAME